MSEALAAAYPEMRAGGFTRYDGNAEFYGRINSLLLPEMHVLDLGAGRGWQLEVLDRFRRDLATLQGKVARVIGVDVDDAVMQNAVLDEAHVYDGSRLPLPDASVDLVMSDWVLEHIEDPGIFSAEVDRVLRPGGWFCARTPHFLSFISIASRMVPNRLHAKVINKAQDGKRQSIDVFPTHYRLNSLGALRRHFPQPRWQHCSYTYSAEPSYHFNRKPVLFLMRVAQYLKNPFAGEVLFVFIRKSPEAAS